MLIRTAVAGIASAIVVIVGQASIASPSEVQAFPAASTHSNASDARVGLEHLSATGPSNAGEEANSNGMMKAFNVVSASYWQDGSASLRLSSGRSLDLSPNLAILYKRSIAPTGSRQLRGAVTPAADGSVGYCGTTALTFQRKGSYTYDLRVGYTMSNGYLAIGHHLKVSYAATPGAKVTYAQSTSPVLWDADFTSTRPGWTSFIRMAGDGKIGAALETGSFVVANGNRICYSTSLATTTTFVY